MNQLGESSGSTRGPRRAYDKAWEDVVRFDMRDVASNAIAEYVDEDSVTVPFLNERYAVNRKARRIIRVRSESPAHPFVAVLVLHYLMGARNIEPSGRLITFRELESGNVYYDAFHRRAILPVAREFGSSPATLLERARRVGAERFSLGDASVRIQAFPRVPVVVVVWMGDDEIPSSANVLFDSTAGNHLHTEDLAAVGNLVADSLIVPDKDWRGW